MSTRPIAALNESVARDIVRQYHNNPAAIAVALAETLITDGRWSANVCKPLIRAYGIARTTRSEDQAPVVYLAGPINGCTDAEANDWRTVMKGHFPDALDPMRRDYRGREDESVSEIVELDKQDIASCDVFVANCPQPSYGTAMEILYAHQIGKPVVVIVPTDRPVSPWIRYHSYRVVNRLQDAVSAVEDLA